MVGGDKQLDFAEGFSELERNGLEVEKLRTVVVGEAPASPL